MNEYINNTGILWVRGVPPGGLVIGDPDDPQIQRLLRRGQIVEASQQEKEGETDGEAWTS
jgi:hypothetical protein